MLISRIRLVMHVAGMGVKKCKQNIRKGHKRIITLRGSKRRSLDNTRIGVREIGPEEIHWIYLAQDGEQ
jgi:hypothetical protein